MAKTDDAPITIAAKEARKASRFLSRIHGETPIVPLERITKQGVVLNIYGKLENVQSVYTFKARGSEWFVYCMMEQYHEKTGRFRSIREKPVLVTASAGNHAQGVALAAKRYGLEAVIFMPEGTPDVKTKRVAELGASIRMVGEVFDVSLEAAKAYRQEAPNRIFVPPFENPQIMAGQGSIMVEILSRTCPYHHEYLRLTDLDWRTPDIIISGIGGGGLASGMGAVVKEFNEAFGKKIKIIGVQTEAADSMYQSIKYGMMMPSTNMQAKTLADGINVKRASQRMVNTVKNYVHHVVRVSEESIIKSIVYIAEHPMLLDRRWHTSEMSDPNVPFRNLPESAEHVHEYRRMNRIEGAAAAPFAAAFFGDIGDEIDWRKIAQGKEELDVYCIFTGGNIPNEKWTALRNEYGTIFADGSTMKKGDKGNI